MSTETDEKEKKKEYVANPPNLDGVSDLSQLIHLEMPNILHNLEYRYCKMKTKYCHTFISNILLSINPHESLPIYNNDTITQFQHAADKGCLPTDKPHPYCVSARSYMNLVQRKKNQSIIVCGEPGSGKTKTVNNLLKYLTVTASTSDMDSKIIIDQIIAVLPILESYGNAKTVMNDNSSRFSTFIKLLYSVSNNEITGNILGLYLETYLLEKQRVVFQDTNERNYHIFYYLSKAFKNDMSIKGELCLDTVDKFHYINHEIVTETFNDEKRFDELLECLKKFRINKHEQNVLWAVTSGILHLGNIIFKKGNNGYAYVDLETCEKYVNNVAKLWGISSKSLINRLETISVVINKKIVVKQIKYDYANSNRDIIAKGIYENVFLWLCERINEELCVDIIKDEKFIG
eukprot:210707_1